MTQTADGDSRPFSRGLDPLAFNLVLTAGLILAGCSSSSPGRNGGFAGYSPRDIRSVAVSVDSVLSDSVFIGATWAAKIVDLATSRTIFSRNDEANLLPASNAKLYTTAAALDQLGPDYRFITSLVVRGEVRDDTLHGDLIVRGSGDPSFSGEFHDGEPLAPLMAWADTLRGLGVRVISGDVVGDDNRFDDEALGYGWQWDDEPYYYAAQVSALSINDNCVDFSVTGTVSGQPAEVSWRPLQTDYVDVINRSITVPGDVRGREVYYRPRATNRIEVLSRVPEGHADTECLAIENPTRFFTQLFVESLKRAGIMVSGEAADIDDLASYPDSTSRDSVVARYESPPLADVVSSINKPSNNLYAELVLRALGVEKPVPDSTIVVGSAAMGVAAAARTFAAAGIDTSRIRIADGSGLSRMHLITSTMTVKLLEYMWRHPDASVRDAFVASLPLGGIDGTLDNRYPAGRARKNVRAKTGTMTSVSSLSGYVWTLSGRPLAFSLMCNNYTSPTSAVRAAQDRIVERLASLP